MHHSSTCPLKRAPATRGEKVSGPLLLLGGYSAGVTPTGLQLRPAAKPNSSMNTSGQLPPRAHVTSGCSERPLQITHMTPFSHHSRFSSLFFFLSAHSLWLPTHRQWTQRNEEPSPSKRLLATEGKLSSLAVKGNSLSAFTGCYSSPCLMPVVGNEGPHSLVPEPAHLPTATRFTCMEKQVLWSSALLVLFSPPEHQQFHTVLYFHNRLD